MNCNYDSLLFNNFNELFSLRYLCPNNFYGSIPEWIGNLRKLTDLYIFIKYNDINIESSSFFRYLPNCSFNGSIPEWIGD